MSSEVHTFALTREEIKAHRSSKPTDRREAVMSAKSDVLQALRPLLSGNRIRNVFWHARTPNEVSVAIRKLKLP